MRPAVRARTTAFSSGKNGPDITELGNTDTPAQASLGMLANIARQVHAWAPSSDIVKGMLANDTVGPAIYAVLARAPAREAMK